MAHTTIFLTRERKVFVGHVCSKCGFPVVSVVTMKIEAQQSYMAFREKAEKKVQEAAEMAVEDEIQFIGTSAKVEPLTGKERSIGGGYGESYCKMSFKGHDSKCPYCSNIERWQIKGGKGKDYLKDISNLKEENFPSVFKTIEEVDIWAESQISKIVNKINEQRNRETNLSQHVSNAIESYRNVLTWRKELGAIPESEYIKNLGTQIETLKSRKSSLGVFNFSEKKEINEQIKTIETNLNNITKVFDEKVSSLKKKLSEEEYKLLYAQAYAFGCSERIRVMNQGDTFVYLFEPYPMPEQMKVN